MWRRLTEIGDSYGVSVDALFALAETGFGCVEEISTQAAAGFADELSHRSGTAHSRRSELLRLLLQKPQPSAQLLRAAAAETGIALTSKIAIFAGDAEERERFAQTAREFITLGPRDDAFGGAALDPERPTSRDQLRAYAETARAHIALGGTVAVADASTSHRQAVALLALMRRGAITDDPLVTAEEHAIPLLFASEPRAASEIVDSVLAPLGRITGPTTRNNLTQALRAWLRHPGQRKAIAHELAMHPQTVRYRMAQLRELFGAALDNPDGRFELELAIRLHNSQPSVGQAQRTRRRPGLPQGTRSLLLQMDLSCKHDDAAGNEDAPSARVGTDL